ncbi:MAG: ATP-binding protein [Candidatus Hodarchaeota archaeon]
MSYPYSSQLNKEFVDIPNPYHPFDIESGRWFYHKHVIKQIKIEFESKPRREVIVLQGIVGSGKSITLKRMVEDRSILGERYIPIYIDLPEIRYSKIQSFLLSIYKKVRNTLGLFGFQIDSSDFLISSGNAINEMKNITDKIENMLDEHNYVIILIFDDFEKLLEEKNTILINSIIGFFKYIIYEKNNFRLILSGKGEISDLAKGTRFGEFLNAARFIDLGLFLDTDTIRDLIINPAKEKFTYENDAIIEIIKLTGNNLYCQQLLCFSIVNLLNKEKRNICKKRDVNIAAKMTINDTREDFSYFWNNLDYECQLIAAALADENITKKQGRYYFFEESSLLNAIFNEEKIDKIFKKLIVEEFINKISGRRFDFHPFKIPLYGDWVKKTHTLLKTIVDNWEKIIDHISLSSLEKIIGMIPIERLPLEKETINTAIIISKKWSEIKLNIKLGKVDNNQVAEFVEIICDILGFEVKNKPKDLKNYFMINMYRLDIIKLSNVLLFALPKQRLTDKDIQFIQGEILRQKMPGSPSFILCFNKFENIKKLAQKRFLSILLIEENDLKNVVLSSDPLLTFKNKILIRKVNPSLISPYKTEGPVRSTFYGRTNEIGRILSTKVRNFAIVGARKIGKTSLLFKIMSEYSETVTPIYIDLEAPKNQNYSSFLSILQERIKEKYDEDVDFSEDLSNFISIIKNICKIRMKPVFFLDEIDTLLKFDIANDFQLLTIFRSLAQERHCQFIISGFEDLYLATKGIGSPLYNFCDIIRLNELKKEEALDLITEPMEQIGIRYDNPEDRLLILKHTSCHPNLIQFFCRGLVDRIKDYDDKNYIRTIYRKDIEDMYRSYEYERYIVHDFYLFFREDVGPIERLIVLLLLENCKNYKIFSTPEILKFFKNKGINISIGKLVGHLANLTLRYIFVQESGGRFHFALSIFPEILMRHDLKNIIEGAIEDARKSL